MTGVETGTMIGIGTGIGIETVNGTANGTVTEIGPGKETAGTAIGTKETTEPRPEKTAETRDTKAIPLAIEVLKRTLVNKERTKNKPVYILFLTRAPLYMQNVSRSRDFIVKIL